MAVITSVYFSSRHVQAAVGTAGAGGVQVKKLCDTLLPEGCLINGVVTAEAELAAALRAFWRQNALPMKNVALTINSTRFISKVVTVPALPPKKLQTLARRELAAMESRTATVTDYSLLGQDAGAGTVTLLASSVDLTFLDGCTALAGAVGFSLCSIDTALAGILQLLRHLPELAAKTCVLLLFDDDNLTGVLLETGSYQYASRRRLFSPHGTAERGAEVAQIISGMVQFQLSGKTPHGVSEVYFAGCHPEDLPICLAGCGALGLDAAPLPDAPRITLPAGHKLADCVYTIGNLIDR